jgi:HlyD family secretion protein
MTISQRLGRHARTAGLLILALCAVAVLLSQCRGPQVAATTVQTQPLEQRLVATGRVANVSRVSVGSEVAGVVRQRLVAEGDRVNAGDVLVVIQADELAANLDQARARLAALQQARRPQAQAQLRQAEANLAQAEREAQRRSALAQRQLVSREDAEQARQAVVSARAAAEQARSALQALDPGGAELAEAYAAVAAAQAMLDKAQVRARVAGTVLTRSVEPGDVVQPGSVLLEIASDGPTELRVPVDEKNLQVLALGQQAQVVADAWPQRPFPARVHYIAPSVDSSRGSVEVRLLVDPVPAFLRQDLTVSANILTARKEAALVVPNTAIGSARGDNQRQVWLIEDGRLKPVAVTLGLRGTTASEVVSGLQAGQTVVVDASDSLQAGQRVRASVIALADGDLPAATD